MPRPNTSTDSAFGLAFLVGLAAMLAFPQLVSAQPTMPAGIPTVPTQLLEMSPEAMAASVAGAEGLAMDFSGMQGMAMAGNLDPMAMIAMMGLPMMGEGGLSGQALVEHITKAMGGEEAVAAALRHGKPAAAEEAPVEMASVPRPDWQPSGSVLGDFMVSWTGVTLVSDLTGNLPHGF